MQFEQIVATMEEIANPALQATWDRSGLQVTTRRQAFSLAGVMLDPVPSNIAKALEDGADFLISHHPLSLKPGLPNRRDNYYESLSMLMQADVPLYAAHTSLDVNLAGPAGWLARALKLRSLAPLEPISGHAGYGYGTIGLLPDTMTGDDLRSLVLSLLQLDWLVEAGDKCPPGHIQKVAICGGAGGTLVELAEKAGADLYITGDVKYHTALDTRIPIWDVGHHSIEEKMMAKFSDLLGQGGITARFYPSDPPFKLVCGQPHSSTGS